MPKPSVRGDGLFVPASAANIGSALPVFGASAILAESEIPILPDGSEPLDRQGDSDSHEVAGAEVAHSEVADVSRREEAGGTTSPGKSRSGILEALALVCVAFALALTLKSYVAEAYEIKGKSMEPSFKTGQRVIVLKTLYEVERGDVVVFASTEDAGKDLIKRVIGLPGDRILWQGGRVYVNGELLKEAYVEHPARSVSFREEEVPAGEYYVLGDNRPDSHDSRYFHSIPEKSVKGEVILRWWPFEDFHLFTD